MERSFSEEETIAARRQVELSRRLAVAGLAALALGGAWAGGAAAASEQQRCGPAGVEQKAPQPLVLTGEEKEIFATLQARVPPPNFGRPDPRGSKLLPRIYERGVLVVAVDKPRIADGGTEVFARSFSDFLAESWKLGLDLEFLPAEEAVKLAAAGRVDIVVSPNAEALGNLSTSPFFVDTQGNTWLTAVLPDKIFAAALGSFLRDALLTGEYGARYQPAFARAPVSEPFRAVFALPPH